MGLLPAKSAFLPGESIPVRVVASNEGPGPLTMYELRRAFMSFTLVDEEGRARTCRREDAERLPAMQPGRFVHVPAGSYLDHSVHLDRFCGELSEGTWDVHLAYTLTPAFDGSAFGLSATTGTFEATTTVAVEAPAPRANLGLHISRTRRTRAGEPFEVTVRLRNHGPGSGLVLPLEAGVLDFHIEDSRGRRIPCELPETRRPRRSDFVELERGTHLETTMDLAEHCRLAEGRYGIRASYGIEEHLTRGSRGSGGDRSFTGTIESNELPFEREAPRRRVDVRLEASLPSTFFEEGEPIPVVLRAVNEGPDRGALAVPNIHVVKAHVERESGGQARCSRPSRPSGSLSPIEVRHDVRRGAAAVGQIDLGDLCEIDRPDRYEVTFTYQVDGDESSQVWTGRAVSEPILFSVTRDRRGRPAAPPPLRERPSRRPPPAEEPETPDESSRRPDRRAGELEDRLYLTLDGPRSARLDRTIDLNLQLVADEEGVVVARLAPWMVRWTVQDERGRRLSCESPQAPSRPPSRRGFVSLDHEQSTDMAIDILEACEIESPGRHFVTAQVRIPPSWDGRRAGLEAWTGTLVSTPITIELRERRRRR